MIGLKRELGNAWVYCIYDAVDQILSAVVALSLMLIRVESGSAGRVASKVLDNASLCCFVMYFFSEFHFNAENTGTH